jgi:hypothetical protein
VWIECRTVAQAFAHWLKCDIAVAGRPCLPPAVDAMHKRVLAGPFVLQVLWQRRAPRCSAAVHARL